MAVIKEIDSLSRNTGYQRQWHVESDSKHGTFYTVSMDASGTFSCSCIGWTRHTPRKDCKHIKQVLFVPYAFFLKTNTAANVSRSTSPTNKTIWTKDGGLPRVQELEGSIPLGVSRKWTVRVRFPSVVSLMDTGELVCNTCKKQPCMHTTYLKRELKWEQKSGEHKLKDESATDHWYISSIGLPACQCNGTEMEVGYGCFRCRTCNFTISEDDYYLKRSSAYTHEVKYPI